MIKWPLSRLINMSLHRETRTYNHVRRGDILFLAGNVIRQNGRDGTRTSGDKSDISCLIRSPDHVQEYILPFNEQDGAADRYVEWQKWTEGGLPDARRIALDRLCHMKTEKNQPKTV